MIPVPSVELQEQDRKAREAGRTKVHEVVATADRIIGVSYAAIHPCLVSSVRGSSWRPIEVLRDLRCDALPARPALTQILKRCAMKHAVAGL